ncbi:BatD family protein [Pseudidiomarina homiensis]|uniref:DUF7939 domain-containing protein n=1 Tax=Pseudidiomarina homiensis TaxID=364198 RepID=A0A432Y578_9GAMM|nr:BatD family protein [Pseudidiomarina homiensis]RUO56082.1 hypothetical protein CWI70_04770 [Pseudidiomarina homiensis]
MVKTVRHLAFISALMLAFGFAGSATNAQTNSPKTVVMSVDKNPVASGDTFILTLTVDQFIEDQEWRPAELLPDFDVMGTSSSSTTQIINGATTREKTFRTVAKAPQQPGDYELGPFTVAGATSNQLTLQVLPADDPALSEQRDAFMRVELDRDEVYVQEQVVLTTKLYLAANLHSGNIIPPELEDADIRQVGRDEDSTEVIDGRMFQVFQRSFVVIPQRSGAQEIRGPVFQGQINVASNRTLFPSFSSTRAVTTAATDLPLTVKPIPQDWPKQHTWLPAELVTLSVSVGNEGSTQPEDEQLQITQGEPLTLTYRLTAVGPLADQLPRLDELVRQLPIGDASIYPEAPESAMNQRNGRLVSQQTLRVAIIPHSAGTLEIPSLELPWFNTQLRGRQQAAAPGQSILVAPGVSDGRDVQPTAAQQTPEPSAPSADEAKANTETVTSPTATSQRELRYWQYAAGALAALWLLTLLFWFLRARQHNTGTAHQEDATSSAREGNARADLRAVQRACNANDAMAVEVALKTWMRAQLKLSGQLNALADYFDHTPLRSQLEHLQSSRFSAGQHDWQEGKALWRALQGALQAHKERQRGQPSELPPLYPQ